MIAVLSKFFHYLVITLDCYVGWISLCWCLLGGFTRLRGCLVCYDGFGVGLCLLFSFGLV